jgi:5'-phosphate synthase pdxT subunit
LNIPLIGKSKIRAIFIRAPVVKEIGKEVEVVAKFEDKIVAVKQNNIIGTSFHPELGDDKLFLLFVKRAFKI